MKERLDLFLLIAFPLAVCTLIDFMRFLLAPWLVGFLLPWPLRPLLTKHCRSSGWVLAVLYLLCLVPFLLEIRLPEPYADWHLEFGWFLLAFSAGRWIVLDLAHQARARRLALGHSAIAAARQALKELSADQAE